MPTEMSSPSMIPKLMADLWEAFRPHTECFPKQCLLIQNKYAWWKSFTTSVLVSTDMPNMVSLTWPTLKLKNGTGPVFPGASSCRVLRDMCWVTCFIWQCVYSAKTVWYQNKKEAHRAPFGGWMQFRDSSGEAESLPCGSAFTVMLWSYFIQCREAKSSQVILGNPMLRVIWFELVMVICLHVI